ncbi:phage/plasmid replication protein, gene II/X family [Nitrosomonas marina]|uniref:Phage/plasmid replication protein, gene II/X family n=1 Tax=Nitrosomonas marina TaxID=917 RepID=A0A1I0G2Z7_9PROT|nr:phage/plasmid replication protein, gene II/X family [Nitrosomonas marina]
MSNEIFIDWVTISQLHTGHEPFPIYTGGVNVDYDATGVARFERVRAANFRGSHETAIRIKSDGRHISLSGNIGRFSRKDNLFNCNWHQTLNKCNRILLGKGLPAFTTGKTGLADHQKDTFSARVSRIDLTANFATGSESQARNLIRWLASRSVSRMKKGRAGDESVWWVNTRHMLKAYIKHIEMLKHGCSEDDPVYQWCKQQGVVRVEIELKRRLLNDLDMVEIGSISDEKLIRVFHDQTEIFNAVDRSDEPDILDQIPPKSRVHAAAWMAGQDLKQLLPNGTFYRHARILREYGIDITEPRNIETFPVKVRIVEMQPISMPDWYSLDDEVEELKAVGE